MRRLFFLLSMIAASVAQADEAPSDEVSGRFHLEVSQTQGYGFRVSATPTRDLTPMQPVNEAGLHLSCLLIPDLAVIPIAEAQSAMEVGADRYCRAQFGDDFAASVGDVYLASIGAPYRAEGQCVQLPM